MKSGNRRHRSRLGKFQTAVLGRLRPALTGDIRSRSFPLGHRKLRHTQARQCRRLRSAFTVARDGHFQSHRWRRCIRRAADGNGTHRPATFSIDDRTDTQDVQPDCSRTKRHMDAPGRPSACSGGGGTVLCRPAASDPLAQNLYGCDARTDSPDVQAGYNRELVARGQYGEEASNIIGERLRRIQSAEVPPSPSRSIARCG